MLTMSLKPSPACYAIIKEFEAFRPTAYKPTPRDVWTCGWGHTHGVTQHSTCTQAQAQDWLEDDMAEAVHLVNFMVRFPLLQHQFDACVSLCFNVEAAFGRHSSLLQALNAGHTAEAQAHFADWCRQGHKVLPGLVRRRAAEAHLFATP